MKKMDAVCPICGGELFQTDTAPTGISAQVQGEVFYRCKRCGAFGSDSLFWCIWALEHVIDLDNEYD